MPFVRKESLLAMASAWLLAFSSLRRSTVESPPSSTAGTNRGGLDAGSGVLLQSLGLLGVGMQMLRHRFYMTGRGAWQCTGQESFRHGVTMPPNTLDAVSPRWCLSCM